MGAARLVILLVALVAGLAAAYLVINLGDEAPPQQVAVVQPVNVENVLVAAQDIPLGSGTSVASYRWQSWPREAIIASYITQAKTPDAIKTYSGAIARSGFLTGEPIKEAGLLVTDRGYMSAILPKGMRAVATRISAETSAGGFVLPNDRVDIILTVEPRGQKSTPYTETILTNIRVLAIDQNIQEKNGEKVVVGETATIELRPRQVELLAQAVQTGVLSLSLRSIEDAAGDSLVEQTGTAGTVTIMRYGSTSIKAFK
ncbi:MAG: Flp pilus assembly protein CpaB [Cohaesibacteraceae bacterium]|nr:Flp pilus assembly protein CpaB [Cohaesibacteraceae bacterium]